MTGLHRLLGICCLCCVHASAWAQSLLPPEKPVVEYDPVTHRYLYYHAYDTRRSVPYKVLSSEEYQREQFSQTLREGWSKQRSDGQGLLGAKAS